MSPSVLLDILSITEKLKCNTRHSWTSNGRQESVADHSWQLALMAMLVCDEYPTLDMDKVIRMCLIHDLGEAFTGDIPAFEKKIEDEANEEVVLYRWIDSFPEEYKEVFLSLLKEMKEQRTEESKLYKALDNLEAVIQHDEADINSWLPLEYDLQFTYGSDKVKFSAYTQALKEEIDKRTLNKINEKNNNMEA